MAVHQKDLDTLAAWAEELGWVLIDTDPPVLTKGARTLQLKFNMAAKLSGQTWIGGPEHGETKPATSSFNKVRIWMETPFEEELVEDGLP